MTEETPVRLRIVRGEPDDVDLAAVLVALATRTPGTVDTADPAGGAGSRGGWGDREARLRLAVHPAPGAWRAAGRAAR